MAKGTIKRFDFRKGFGFIEDDKTGEDYFFHKSAWEGDSAIRRGMEVKFKGFDSEKGPQAESVVPADGSRKKSKPAAKTPTKPATLEERVASLENSIGLWKTISLVSLVGVLGLSLMIFVF